jgi:hypothetical protein
MSLTINHETNEITNATGTVTINGTAVGGDNTPIFWSGSRGVFGGGNTGSGFTNVMQYITIATTGNATDFGDLTSTAYYHTACSNGTRGVFAGGYNGSDRNVIEYITVATTGNATDFGDLTAARDRLAACSNGIRGVFAGGDASS